MTSKRRGVSLLLGMLWTGALLLEESYMLGLLRMILLVLRERQKPAYSGSKVFLSFCLCVPPLETATFPPANYFKLSVLLGVLSD